jgi:hypothetical protein
VQIVYQNVGLCLCQKVVQWLSWLFFEKLSLKQSLKMLSTQATRELCVEDTVKVALEQLRTHLL